LSPGPNGTQAQELFVLEEKLDGTIPLRETRCGRELIGNYILNYALEYRQFHYEYYRQGMDADTFRLAP
jgi:hypothetical protein